jgi:hypothetical protein
LPEVQPSAPEVQPLALKEEHHYGG